MSSIGEVIGQFTDLYGAGRYHEALELVRRERANHPAHDGLLLCFSAAMSARTGDTSGALSAFQTALDCGYWYHEGALRSDPDFESLQAIPAFKTLVEQNGQRRQVALADAKPVLRVLETADMPASAPLLIALHGNLSNVDTYAVFWQPIVEKGWRVALPQSSKFSWLSGFYDWTDVDAALDEIEQHYRTLVTDGAVNPACLVIAGFSMGALVAECVTISKRLPVQGLLWIEGLPDEELESILAAQRTFDFRAYFAAGQSQDFVATAEALSAVLEGAGIPCQVETMPSLHHEIPASFEQTLDRALDFLCG